ncbi:MAG TPA: circularly permuted type 2 ATP-grasp protein, partial [Gammaproteobacteria bacterium]|nr:circularly permuted type 2 ATP-grasp protein [Gammaproteobacteria bacterium]
MDWTNYRSVAFDELIAADGGPRPAAGHLVRYLAKLSDRDVASRQVAASAIARMSGITFTVYSDGRNVDRPLPFDLIPRVLARSEWERTEAGLKQRIRALNMFISDVYGEQRIFKDKVVPAGLLANSVNFRKECVGVKPPLGIWAHVCGSDLVRDADGKLYALEDNLRIPSGVS